MTRPKKRSPCGAPFPKLYDSSVVVMAGSRFPTDFHGHLHAEGQGAGCGWELGRELGRELWLYPKYQNGEPVAATS